MKSESRNADATRSVDESKYPVPEAGHEKHSRISTLLICLAVTLLAGSLRFYRLGDWSFAGDELATFIEADSLFGRESKADADEDIFHVLPRLIPGSYAMHDLGYRIFGRDEFGSRAMLALLGTLHVAFVFLLGTRIHGRRFGLILALLLACWPEHIFHSQQNRYYILPMILSSIAFLLATWGLQQPSKQKLFLALGVSVLAVSTHTLAVGLVPLVYFGVLASLACCRARISKRFTVNGISILAFVAAFVLLYALPKIQGNWNGGSHWMYSPVHALLTIPGALGWTVVVFSTCGAFLLLTRREPQHVFALVCLASIVGFAVVVPLAVNFHPEYLTIVVFPAIYAAAWFVQFVYDRLVVHSRGAAVAFVMLAALGNLPSLVSHYRDGSRPDFRSAATWLNENAGSDDTVIALSAGNIRHYAPALADVQPLLMGNPGDDFEWIAHLPGRTWIVVQCGRGGHDPALESSLNRHCRRATSIGRKRYDYYVNRIDIFVTQSADLEPLLASQ